MNQKRTAQMINPAAPAEPADPGTAKVLYGLEYMLHTYNNTVCLYTWVIGWRYRCIIFEKTKMTQLMLQTTKNPHSYADF